MIRFLSTLSYCLLLSSLSHAQDLHYTQVDAVPLSLNPAFTGMFNGDIRASALYATNPGNFNNSYYYSYVTFGGSVDLPVYSNKRGDYIGIGGQFMKSVDWEWGGPNSYNVSGIASVAYHRQMGRADSAGKHKGELAVGLQYGYMDNSLNVFYKYGYIPAIGVYWPAHVQTYTINAGISYSGTLSSRFSYVIGAAAYNLNQPKTTYERNQVKQTGADALFIASLGANWIMSGKWSMRPAILYQRRDMETNYIVSDELYYVVSGAKRNRKAPVALFLGVWHSTDDVFTYLTGVEFTGFHIGLGYIAPPLHYGSSSGLRLDVKYILRNHNTAKRTVPCTRF